MRQKGQLGRIKDFAQIYFSKSLEKHLCIEDGRLFPFIGAYESYVKGAVKEYRKLKRLVLNQEGNPKAISKFEEELEAHVRFKEPRLFNRMQEQFTQSRLQQAVSHEYENPVEGDEDWVDKFER